MLDDTGGLGVARTSLALTFECFPCVVPHGLRRTANRVTSLLPLLACGSLKRLTQDRAVVTGDDLALVLASFPHLQSLVLDRCVVESVTPLLDAYARETTRVAALSLRRVYDLRMRDKLVYSLAPLGAPLFPDGTLNADDAPVWIAELVEALARGVTSGVLEELHVDVTAMASPADARTVLERLAHAVGTTHTLPLRRLHVTCDNSLLPLCETLFSALRDTPR